MTVRQRRLRTLRYRQKVAFEKIQQANDLLRRAQNDLFMARAVAHRLYDNDSGDDRLDPMNMGAVLSTHIDEIPTMYDLVNHMKLALEQQGIIDVE